MTLTFCRIFNSVVKHGSFLKASEQLHMTPSAVSHAVADAERQAGFRLFNRTKNGITLTESGAAIYPSVLRLLASEEALMQSVDQINGLRSGSVKVGIFNSVCTNWMPEIFRRFDSLYPGISIDLYEGSYDDVIEWIKNGSVDFGFLSTSCTTELEVDGIYRDPLICIVPESFKSRREGFITVEEMRDRQFVIQRQGSDADVQALFKKHGLKFHSSCHLLDDTSIMTMIACGRGISVMASLTAKGLVGGLKILRLEPEECRVIGLSALDKKSLSPAARRLYMCIEQYMKELEDEKALKPHI